MKNNFELRFGISDGNGNRSATWSIVNPIGVSDIYISCRELHGSIKTSLHQSGSWHVGYSKKAFEEILGVENEKYIEIWDKPNNLSNDLSLALRIVTFNSAVSTPNTVTKQIHWIPICEDGYSIEVCLIISSQVLPIDSWPGKNSMGSILIGSCVLSNGNALYVVYTKIPEPDKSLIKVPQPTQVKFYKDKSIADLEKADNLKMILFGQESDNSRTMYDCKLVYVKPKD